MTPDKPLKPTTNPPETGQPRKVRHGCLMALLLWLFFANVVAAILSPLVLASIRQKTIPEFPDWVAWAIGGCSAVSILFVLALFRWKRWGFYGYALAAIAIFALNVHAGLGVGAAALGLVGTVTLFAALQIGGERKGWSQLE